MFFTKYPHASNFSFATSIKHGELRAGAHKVQFIAQAYENGIYRVGLKNRDLWKGTRRIVELEPGEPTSSLAGFNLTADGFSVGPIKTVKGAGIGISGEASMFQFEVDPQARFYGMGEKTFGRLELSGLRAKYWNTDVWGDFHFAQWMDHPSDPPYASIPYLIVEQKGVFVGRVDDIVLNPEQGAVSGLALGDVNRDLFDQKSKGIIIPYRWVTAIGDIIIMRHLTRNAKAERKNG